MDATELGLVAKFMQDLAIKAELDTQINDDFHKLSGNKVLTDFLSDFAAKTNDNIEIKTVPPCTPPKVEITHAVETPYAATTIGESLPPEPLDYAKSLNWKAPVQNVEYNPTQVEQEGFAAVNWVDSQTEAIEKGSTETNDSVEIKAKEEQNKPEEKEEDDDSGSEQDEGSTGIKYAS